MLKGNLSYVVQGVGLVIFGVGLVLIIEKRLAVGLLVFGGLVWWVGQFLRQKKIL